MSMLLLLLLLLAAAVGGAGGGAGGAMVVPAAVRAVTSQPGGMSCAGDGHTTCRTAAALGMSIVNSGGSRSVMATWFPTADPA